MSSRERVPTQVLHEIGDDASPNDDWTPIFLFVAKQDSCLDEVLGVAARSAYKLRRMCPSIHFAPDEMKPLSDNSWSA